MRLERDVIVCCLLAFLLLVVTGCGKKTDEDEPASPATTETRAETVEAEEPASEVTWGFFICSGFITKSYKPSTCLHF